MEIVIRRAKLTNVKNLAVLKQQVWISTYATEGIVEEFSDYVLSGFSLEKVRNAILDINNITFIATSLGRVVGCAEVYIRSINPDPSFEPCPEITTLYVLEKFQGFGVGKRLLSECIKLISEMKFAKTWLTVYYRNEKAIRFYYKQNFIQTGETDFELGKSKYKNYIMMKTV